MLLGKRAALLPLILALGGCVPGAPGVKYAYSHRCQWIHGLCEEVEKPSAQSEMGPVVEP
jgi:hypothetical protein